MLLADSPVDVSLEDVVTQLHSLAGTEGRTGPGETECEEGVTMAAREVRPVKIRHLSKYCTSTKRLSFNILQLKN